MLLRFLISVQTPHQLQSAVVTFYLLVSTEGVPDSSAGLTSEHTKSNLLLSASVGQVFLMAKIERLSGATADSATHLHRVK